MFFELSWREVLRTEEWLSVAELLFFEVFFELVYRPDVPPCVVVG